MKKSRILMLVLSVALVAVMAISLFACNEKCTEHTDENNDFLCDNCGETLPNPNDGNNNNNNNNVNDGKEDYTFTLKDSDLNPVQGATIRVNVNGADGEIKVTDANGTVVFRVEKTAMLVMVEILEVPEDYDFTESIFRYENGEKSIISNTAEKKDTYVIKVVDQNGDAVEGVQVQLCFGDVCMVTKPFTNAQGTASYTVAGYDPANAYASVNALPDGYALKEGEKLNEVGATDYTHYDDFNSNKEVVIEIVKLNMVTVTAGDFFSNYADIEIKIYDTETNALVKTVVTGANGQVSFPIDKALSEKVGANTVYNYYMIVAHKDNDPRYTWGMREEGRQDLTSANMKINVYYLEKVNYTVNVTRTDSTLTKEGIRVVFYNRLFEEVATAETNASGTATFTMIPYDVYYVKLENVGDAAISLYEIKKDGVTSHTINIDDNAVLGSLTTPVDLVYGYSVIPAVNVNDIIYCRVVNPQGATLVIDADVIIIDENENQYSKDLVSGSVVVPLGNSTQLLKIEARETLNYWGANVTLKGTSGNNELIKESEIGGSVSVNLGNGKYYYTFEADESTATLTLSSSADVKFEIEGVETNKAVLAKGDTINFAVIGEGQATFNVDFTAKYYDYMVSLNKELIGLDSDLEVSGVEIDLVYDGNVIASGTTNKGTVTFKNIQEYPTDKIKAEVKTLPENYVKFYGNLTGSYFSLQDYDKDGDGNADAWQYETSYVISLDRKGTQTLPYKWATEGQSNASTYEIKVPESGKAYIEGIWSSRNLTDDIPKFYYVYVAGNHTLRYYTYNLDMENYDFSSIKKESTYNAELNATVLEVPLDLTICLEVVAPAGDIKVRWGTEILDLTAGDPVATGTQDNPFGLVFAETITTPDFIQGTSLDNPGVSAYYYTYTAPVDMGIQILNENAVISVFVNGYYTDITSGVFNVTAGDVISIMVESAEGTLDGVRFAVKGV